MKKYEYHTQFSRLTIYETCIGIKHIEINITNIVNKFDFDKTTVSYQTNYRILYLSQTYRVLHLLLLPHLCHCYTQYDTQDVTLNAGSFEA